MPNRFNKRYAIGIDGGVNTGFAVWDRKEKKFAELTSEDFWEVFSTITSLYPPALVDIYVEDPSKNKPVFFKKGANNHKKMLKVAQNVGGVKRETELLIEGLEKEGYEVQRVRPGSAKWDADTFKNMTKYKGRTNEHSRDAGRLVFQR
ncbi:hypothetical protein [Gracilimonas sediminicola]|uniref:Uncharacterized protein n=1 Tax=Gracilimonas sediminicola TaxID=2952158 RepID=A0A9X2L0P6_9BACT|nr:hypothetical protein [Gracilimonas sediminicola]MCP9290034.1 hypothetical protein [Gracilimonas sediminicola]